VREREREASTINIYDLFGLFLFILVLK